MTANQPKPPIGRPERLGPDIRRIIAPNPSPMTYWGTNTYLVGTGEVAVIDPGPASPAHLQAILGALRPGERISHILVTHAHLDHSALARRLAEASGAPVLAYGNALAGRSAIMAGLAAGGLSAGGEGVDTEFTPDICLEDGAVISGDGWKITALWTPGHMSNHMSFDLQGHVFTGDHVMGWASSLVSPPDGDLAAFMASSARLAARDDIAYLPGHGAPVSNPAARIDWLIRHRLDRESEILAALDAAPGNISDLTGRIYHQTPPALRQAAARNVFAHLIDLHSRNIVTASPRLEFSARFTLK